MTEIIQIIPRFSPGRDGICDYSLRLAGGLKKNHSLRFLAFEADVCECVDWIMEKVSSESLEKIERGSTLLWHVHLGHPSMRQYFLFLAALKTIKKKNGLRVICFFHELGFPDRLPYSSPLRSMSLWKTARIADKIITSNSVFKSTIQRFTKKTITCIPVFSCIGESKKSKPFNERDNRLIIFGGTNRTWLYTYARDEIKAVCDFLKIRDIVDMGPDITLPSLNGITVVKKGNLTPEEVRDILANSRYGMLYSSKFPGLLAKSSVFAAYAANGTIPITNEHAHSESDGLFVGKQYLTPKELKESAEKQDISKHVRAWYGAHDLQATISIYLALLSEEHTH